MKQQWRRGGHRRISNTPSQHAHRAWISAMLRMLIFPEFVVNMYFVMMICAKADFPVFIFQDVCTKSVTMNTRTLTQNNLGGAGPDTGAEELRYSKAANVNGQSVALVVTARGGYSAGKPSATGINGAFGSINVKCNTEVTLLFKAVDSETGDAVMLDNFALTWFISFDDLSMCFSIVYIQIVVSQFNCIYSDCCKSINERYD